MGKARKIRGDKVIWIVVFLLALISVISVYTSSSIGAYDSGKSLTGYLIKQLFFVLLGIAAIFACYKIPLGVYRKSSILLLIVSCTLLIYVIFKGMVLNHAARWINIFGISFQPSELTKIALVLYLARTLETTKFDTFKQFVLKIIVPVGITIILTLYGSASAAILMTFTTAIILFCSTINRKYILWTVGIGLVCIGLIFAIHSLTGAFPRLDTFTGRIERHSIKNEENLSDEKRIEYNALKYQSDQAIEAIQLGQLTGRGPGNSIKRNTLPNSSSDFIYSIIVEEWGLIGGMIIIMLYLWFFYRCLFIARFCKKIFSMIVVLGLSTQIISQAFLHIYVNINIAPVTGQTLPLISAGGTSMVIISCAFGIILSVNRTLEITAEKEKQRQLELEKEEQNG